MLFFHPINMAARPHNPRKSLFKHAVTPPPPTETCCIKHISTSAGFMQMSKLSISCFSKIEATENHVIHWKQSKALFHSQNSEDVSRRMCFLCVFATEMTGNNHFWFLRKTS